MSEVTRILSQLEAGDPQAAAQLLPLVYESLRKLAAARLAQEQPGQTLQPTALVHEAYVRLVGEEQHVHWKSRGHFYGAAAEAMRRILIENARRRASLKRGGGRSRVELDDVAASPLDNADELLALDEALTALSATDPETAELVKLRFFGGLTFDEAAAALGISSRTARRNWSYARAWLQREMEKD